MIFTLPLTFARHFVKYLTHNTQMMNEKYQENKTIDSLSFDLIPFCVNFDCSTTHRVTRFHILGQQLHWHFNLKSIKCKSWLPFLQEACHLSAKIFSKRYPPDNVCIQTIRSEPVRSQLKATKRYEAVVIVHCRLSTPREKRLKSKQEKAWLLI